MKSAKTIGWWLVVVGAVNWGLVGLGVILGGTGWNVVNMILGGWPTLEAVAYVLVGLSGVWLLWEKVGGGK